MTKQKKHISEKDFQRYLGNRMTEEERNAFERELQKHPFEAEALEGLQQISPDELSNDLQELKSKIVPERRTSRYRYWAAAATILLLISSSILWFQLKDKSPMPELTENKKITKEKTTVERGKGPMEKSGPEKGKSLQTMEFTDSAAGEKSEIKLNIHSKEKSAKGKNEIQPAAQQKTTLTAKKIISYDTLKKDITGQSNKNVVIRGVTTLSTKPNPNNIELPQKFGEITTLKDQVIHGKVYSLSDSMTLPETAILQKEAKNASLPDKNGNMNMEIAGKSDRAITTRYVGINMKLSQMSKDSVRIISKVPNQSKAGETVVTGYGKPELNKALSSTLMVESNVNLWPVGGMEKYEQYLEEKAVLPRDYKQNRAVIKLLVKFDKFGAISGITNKNGADSLLFEQAKKIIEEGPKWTPEIRNRQPVDSEKELKIVFRKKK